jgi:hypothetical protein
VPVGTGTASAQRAPTGPWTRTWLAALAFAFAALAAWEGFWRLEGHAPGLSGDSTHWVLERRRLGSGPRAVAVLGDSRALHGIDLDVLGRELGSERPVQLAIEGSTPVPILLDLAEDATFRGLVLLTVSPARFFEASAEGARLPSLYLERSRAAASIQGRVELQLDATVERAAVFRKPELSPLMLIRMRRWPAPRAVRPDRSRRVHWVRNAQLRATEQAQSALLRSLPQLSGEERRFHLERVARAIDRLESRGGEVVLVRMPSGGLHREVERERAPRARSWDALVRATGAPAIHFEDHPDLHFECPDGSHLDAADVEAFTRVLAAHVCRGVRSATLRVCAQPAK